MRICARAGAGHWVVLHAVVQLLPLGPLPFGPLPLSPLIPISPISPLCRLVPCHSDLPLGLPAAPRDVVQCACVSGIPRAGGIPRSALVYQPDMLPDRPYQVRIRLKCTYQPDILA